MQRPKEHVRARFIEAALASFAEVGYETTTMAAVAERAGSSVGNLYKYFDSKEALFAAAVPEELVVQIRRLTRARIEALGTLRDIQLVPPDARYHVLAGELLDLCLANRHAVVILLGRPEGTPFASFREDFTTRLVEWALDYVKGAWPAIRPTVEIRFALKTIYRNYLAALADAFVTFSEVDRIREAASHLTAHHQGGLKRLFETAATLANSTPVGPNPTSDRGGSGSAPTCNGASSDDTEARSSKPSFDESAPQPNSRGTRSGDAGPSAAAARPRRADRTRRS